MDCKEAQILFAPHIMGDLEPGIEQYHRLEAHLLSCQRCQESYEIRKQTIKFIKQHKTIFARALGTTEEKKATEQAEISLSWKNIETRLEIITAQERSEKRAKYRRFFIRVSKVAACLIVGVSIFLTFSIYATPKIASKSARQQITLVPQSSLKIEQISKNGGILIPADQQIASSDELKMLVINGKHSMIMNTNTSLSIEPLVENCNIGCLVKLTSGQIYTHVRYDGHPFIVDTAHGRAVITGTTFDVKVTNDGTTLVVSKGVVQFESGKGAEKVTAGQISRIAGKSAPSIPLLCNTAELTAWVTGYKAEPLLAKAESNTDPWKLILSLRKEPIILEETDYAAWVEQERNWFEQEFPQIFQLKDALAKEGIEVDYSQLLISAGDVWQFVCSETLPTKFSAPDFNSLLAAASHYGFDRRWLLENVPAAKYAMEKPALSKDIVTGLNAFERWLKYLDKAAGSQPPAPMYSYHASVYLTKTRSLIWFALRDGSYSLTDKDRAEVLALLQNEVIAACQCQNDELYPQEESKLLCDKQTCQGPIDRIIGYIKTMRDIEKRIAEYEIDN